MGDAAKKNQRKLTGLSDISKYVWIIFKFNTN